MLYWFMASTPTDPISETGVDPKVSALVYVAARTPDEGEDFSALAAKYPKARAGPGAGTIRRSRPGRRAVG
jgi:hypothetical protein